MKLLLILFICLTTLLGQTQTLWQIDPNQSKVSFQVKNMGFKVNGGFEKFDARVQTAQTNQFQDAQIECNVDVKSINTKNKMRDRDLMKKDWFDADNHPLMNFKSISFKQDGDRFILTGMLTIKGISREETFIVKPVGALKTEAGKTYAYFKTEHIIDRSAYGLKSGFSVSNEVTIQLDIVLLR